MRRDHPRRAATLRRGAARTRRTPPAAPAPATWSALEYTVHTTEGLRFYAHRISKVLAEDRPQLHALHVDEACERDRYNDRAIADAEHALSAVTAELGQMLDDISPSDWWRVGMGIDGDERTVDMLARRAAHEVQHHELDVERILAR
jgi:hypothetical protein